MYVVITFLRLPTTCNSVFKNTVGSGRGNCMWVSYCIIQGFVFGSNGFAFSVDCCFKSCIEPFGNKLKVFDLASKH